MPLPELHNFMRILNHLYSALFSNMIIVSSPVCSLGIRISAYCGNKRLYIEVYIIIIITTILTLT